MAIVCHEYKLAPEQFYGLTARELEAMVKEIQRARERQQKVLQALAGATGLA